MRKYRVLFGGRRGPVGRSEEALAALVPCARIARARSGGWYSLAMWQHAGHPLHYHSAGGATAQVASGRLAKLENHPLSAQTSPQAAAGLAFDATSTQKGRDLLREVLSPVSFGRCVLQRTPGPPIRPLPAQRYVYARPPTRLRPSSLPATCSPLPTLPSVPPQAPALDGNRRRRCRRRRGAAPSPSAALAAPPPSLSPRPSLSPPPSLSTLPSLLLLSPPPSRRRRRAAVAAEPPRRRRRRRRRRRCLRCPAVEGVPPSNPARAASRARPAAAAGDFRAVSASPAAPPTTTQPLGPAWCPFPLFSHVLSPFVSRFSFLCVALCRPSKVASTAVAAAVAAVAAAGAAGMAAAARAAALAAARAPERTVAEAQARFSALFSAIRSSSLAAVAAAPEAAMGVERCQWRPRRRPRGARSRGAAGGSRRRRRGGAGVLPAMASLSRCASLRFHEKSACAFCSFVASVRVSVRCACAFLTLPTLLYT